MFSESSRPRAVHEISVLLIWHVVESKFTRRVIRVEAGITNEAKLDLEHDLNRDYVAVDVTRVSAGKEEVNCFEITCDSQDSASFLSSMLSPQLLSNFFLTITWLLSIVEQLKREENVLAAQRYITMTTLKKSWEISRRVIF